jgi:hypothetical protein
MLDMKRREFIALVGSGGLLLAAKVRRARAQQPAMPVIGFLHGGSPEPNVNPVAAFGKGWPKLATSRARTWRSNSAGRRGTTIGCRNWRPI